MGKICLGHFLMGMVVWEGRGGGQGGAEIDGHLHSLKQEEALIR